MMSRRLLVLALLGAAGCSAAPVQEHTPEQAVWAAMIQGYGEEGMLADSTAGRACQDCPPPADVPADVWESFVQRNRTSVSLRAHLPAGLRARVRSDGLRPNGKNCRGPTVLVLSRVGFSADGSLALASYDLHTGPGPYPRCGYATGFTVLLRKEADGTWRQAGTAGGYIT